MDDLLQQGITAFQAGKRDDSRKLFAAAIQKNLNDESAWGWMYNVCDNDKERIDCLKQVLRINPSNEKANRLFNKLTGNQAKSNKTSKKLFGKIVTMSLALLVVIVIVVIVIAFNNQKALQQLVFFAPPLPTITQVTFPTLTPTITLTNTPVETLTPTQDSKQQLINEVIPLLDTRTTESFKEARYKLIEFRYISQMNWKDEEVQTLYWYADSMIDVLAGDTLLYEFQDISPDYNGVYHKQIISEMLKHMSKEEWKTKYEENRPIVETVQATFGREIGRSAPAIGMTAQQVLDSQWGKPTKINKTITANVIYEQWVYSVDRYIYLENGIVVSIQE